MVKNTEHFKELLLKEVTKIEAELSSVGRRNNGVWEAVETDNTGDSAEDGEVADSMEELDNNNAVVLELERQLIDVKSALDKIEAGKYGICEISGEDIELDRLEANPAARTCKKHMN